jgi:hypothetical protein
VRPARLLAALNRRLLEAYSRRTIDALLRHLPLPAALPWLERLLASNVEKEVRKDRAVIFSAARAAAEARSLDAVELQRLLQAAQAIDRDFLAQARGPLEIPVPYERINPLRAARIRRLFEATQKLCETWTARRSLRSALAAAYPQDVFERLLYDLLISYALETRELGAAVRMPALLQPLRRRVLAGLYGTMESAARSLAHEAAAWLLKPKKAPLGPGR